MSVARPGRKLLASAIVAALASFTVSSLHAQEANAAAQDEDEPTTLSTIVVTAQKREEALQDVPIAVTALDWQVLQDNGVRDIKDLQVVVPGLTVTSTQNEAITTARLRGIGTVGDNPGLESSVGVVIDGVYRPRNSVGFGDLGELERVEVLKGPQGTVFGKNTSAGVINIMTRRPSYMQRIEGELTTGNHGALGVSASYNDAISDNAAFRVYAAKRTRDGWMDVESGKGPRQESDDYDQNYHLVRGQLLFEPNDAVDVLFIADYSSREENCCTAVQLVSGGTAPLINALAGGNGISIPADPFRRTAYSNRSTDQDIKDMGVSAQVDWDTNWFGGATLTSITAQRDWESIAGLDFDFTTADLIYRNADPDESLTGFNTFSQELRLTGTSGNIDWMVGGFFADEHLDRNESYRVGADYEPYLSTLVGQQVLGAIAAQLAPFAPLGIAVNQANPALFFSQVSGRPYGTNFAGLAALDQHRQHSNTLAFFTNNTWHATDQLDMTFGLRFTREEKELLSSYSNPNGSPGCAATLANPAGRVGAALAGRITGWAFLPPQVQAALIGAAAPQIAGYMCLPWANALHHGRTSDQERTEDEWSGTLKAAYRFNENVMGYVSGARGYKAGGFNLDRVQSSDGLSSGGAGILPVMDTSFPGEFVNSFELGTKTTWADGNLLLNATLFHQTYEDFQLNSFLGTSFVVRSIPEVVSQGVDTEIMWQPAAVEGLLLQGGLMYADTRYANDIPGADFELPGQMYKLPGNRVSFAPYWSGSLSATYEWDMGGDLVGRFNVGGKYMSDYNTGSDLDVEKHQDAFSVVNARFVVAARDNRWAVELWGTNVFDEDYVQVGFDGPLQAVGSPQPGDPLNTYNAFLGAPAMYGVTFRVAY